MDRIYQGSNSAINRTATAGTPIVALLAPRFDNVKQRVTRMSYRCGSTAHTVSLLKPGAKVLATDAVADGASTITVASLAFLGQTLQANDYIVVHLADGRYSVHKVSSVSGTTITIADTFSAAVSANAYVWLMGTAGDPQNVTFPITASALNTFEDPISGIFETGFQPILDTTVYERPGNGDPIVFLSNNATVAGTLEQLTAMHARW